MGKGIVLKLDHIRATHTATDVLEEVSCHFVTRQSGVSVMVGDAIVIKFTLFVCVVTLSALFRCVIIFTSTLFLVTLINQTTLSCRLSKGVKPKAKGQRKNVY